MKRPKVRSKVRCDGKRFSWTARWVQDTCGECGKPNDDWTDEAEPLGPHVGPFRDGHCLGCGAKLATIGDLTRVMTDTYRAAFEAHGMRQNAFITNIEDPEAP